jgi:hypothetical protein
MLPDQTSIKSYHVYAYTFLDDLSYIRDPYDQFTDEEKYKIDDAIRLVGERFREYGWERRWPNWNCLDTTFSRHRN